MSNKVLSQEEIDELLVAITEIPPIRTENAGEKKIKICDFLRPDILSKEQLYRMEIIMELYAARLTDFFQREYGLDTAIQFDGIDQLTRKEFIYSIPDPTFTMCSKWLDGFVILNINPEAFSDVFLDKTDKTSVNKKSPIKAIEKKIFSTFFAPPLFEELLNTFRSKSNVELRAFSDERFEEKRVFLPYTENPDEMGVLVPFKIKSGKSKKGSYTIDLFFNSTVIEQLCKNKIISEDDTATGIPLERPLGNFVAELGRCHISDDIVLKENQVLELESDKFNRLGIFINGKKSFNSDAVYIDDMRGIWIEKKTSKPDISDSDNFYNIRVVWGSANVTQEEINGYDKGVIIELSEEWNSPVYIYRRGLSDEKEKLCALGKVYMLYERLAVKVTQVI